MFAAIRRSIIYNVLITQRPGPHRIYMPRRLMLEHQLRSDRKEQARRLALKCQEDAVKAGISSEDLEAAVEGNLFSNMLQALDAAEFRQMYRDQIADQEGGA
jgi:hypothetical protein